MNRWTKRTKLMLGVTILGMGLLSNTLQTQAKVVLKQNKISIYVGKSTQAKVKSGGKIISCTSSSKKIATVNRKGKISAKKAGKAVVTIKTKNGKAKCYVNVGAYAKNMKIKSASSFTLSVGEKGTIKTSISPANVLLASCTYTSKNKSIAMVSKKGKITAKGSGLTYITVKSKAITKKK